MHAEPEDVEDETDEQDSFEPLSAYMQDESEELAEEAPALVLAPLTSDERDAEPDISEVWIDESNEVQAGADGTVPPDETLPATDGTDAMDAEEDVAATLKLERPKPPKLFRTLFSSMRRRA